MDSAYALKYQDLYRRHWWWRARERLILSTIAEIRRYSSTAKILDVGCGNGLMFDQLAKFGDVEGVESDPSLVTVNCPWRDKIYLSAFDGRFHPGKRYSLILMLDVLEHFHDPASSLKRALELLDLNGTLLLTVPAFACLWTSHDDINRHFNRYTKKTLIALASQVDLKILQCRYFFHWIFLPKLLLHSKERCFGASCRTPRVPHPRINELLLKFCVAEQKLFHNVPVPIGSSIIAIGQRRKPADTNLT